MISQNNKGEEKIKAKRKWKTINAKQLEIQILQTWNRA